MIEEMIASSIVPLLGIVAIQIVIETEVLLAS
jgi:hypothetical protein